MAHTTLARDALIRHDDNGSVAQARAAVARAPMEAANTALLGTGYLQLGRTDQADAAYMASDRMGWREPATQTYMMSRAVAHGDFAAAAARLDVLLRQQSDFQRDAQMLAPVEANLYAQDAWVRRLATRPPGLATYSGDVGALSPEELGVRAAVLADLADRGVRLGCDGIDMMVHTLVTHESFDDAHTLWAAHCPAQSGNLVWDGHLAALSDQMDKVSEFRWQMVPAGDLTLTLRGAGSGDGQWLEVGNNGLFPTVFLRQMLVLEPGRYRLSWMEGGEGAGAGSGDAISPRLSCGEVALLPRQGSHAQASVTIPQNCPQSWLEFQMAPSGRPATFGDIALSQEGHEQGGLGNNDHD